MRTRSEHPRPDCSRSDWLSLDGEWEFEFDPTNAIDGDGRMLDRNLALRIRVPFVYQSPLSGIGDRGMYPTVWYRKTFDLPEGWAGKRILLNFGAVDYRATVRVNGTPAGFHAGGYTPFRFDVTPLLRERGNVLLVKVDDGPDLSQPRGKQSWGASFACWYTQMTGIWQPVWLEAVPANFIGHHTADPFIGNGNGSIIFTALPDRPETGATLRARVARNGSPLAEGECALSFPSTKLTLSIPDPEPWSPEHPALYEYTLALTGKTGTDSVHGFAAFRTVGLTEDGFLLNGDPRPLRLVLDQGFWPESLYTPPSDEAMIRDITLAKEMGFDGCRKHMKLEDPRFLHHADRLGFLVWSELPAPYSFTPESRLAVLEDLHGMIRRDGRHPSVVTWVVYNESWGIPGAAENPEIRNWLLFLMELIRSLDPSRPAVDNDGWHHALTDILTYHSYARDGKTLGEHHREYLGGGAPAGRTLMAEPKDGPPVRPHMPSEFGGIGFRTGSAPGNAWGYEGIPSGGKEFLERFGELVNAARALSPGAGFCYTQLTDVEQEINGLLTPDRQPKFPTGAIRKIIRGE